ncbi:Retrotransposable element Tf2 155 kDa protein type 3 [Ceratocystis platani]|uniref:Retrotransposable element Tf2 155 kDa protein type 3 n=1 Tax=Ceratocystis fimbriata f. sp. platani TaxID=88771 RepID=A0A0F8D8D0_CERFI|nr:Retrotransposable element Tf2 155 kDa protein type 3 [Ceratocystis platani]
MNDAERNYAIHDKELLGVICCFKEWYAMLRGLVGFTLVTNHKNLQYFAKKQLLNERQIRWSEFLQTLPPLKVIHRPGRLNQAADALSRKEQDEPKDPSEGRELQLWKHEQDPPLQAMLTQRQNSLFENRELQDLWDEGADGDEETEAIWSAVRSQDTTKLPKSVRGQLGDFTEKDGRLKPMTAE